MPKIALTLTLLSVLAAAAQADIDAIGALESDTHTIHHSVFNSKFLKPQTAKALGVRRAGNRAVVNISARAKRRWLRDAASEAEVRGGYRDLLKYHPLTFRPVRETGAVYYLAEFPFTHLENLRFDIEVKPEGGVWQRLRFEHKFHIER